MANEIETNQSSLSGSTLYAVLDGRDGFNQGLRWNGSGFEAVSLADWPAYKVPLTEAAGTGYFSANLPGGIAAGSPLFVTVYKQSGGSAAASDSVVAAGPIGYAAIGPVTLATAQPNYAPATAAALAALVTTIGVEGSGLTGIPVVTLSQIEGALASGIVTLAPSGLDAIAIEEGLNARKALAIISAALAGTLSGASTTTVTINGANTTTPRIVATVDASGDRSSVTLTPPE